MLHYYSSITTTGTILRKGRTCTYYQQGDHTILFQLPEILLFDMFVSQSGDGVGTDGFYLKSVPNRVIIKFMKLTK